MSEPQTRSSLSSSSRKLTQTELLAEAKSAFGENPLDWKFRCPSCGDEANGHDFKEAGVKDVSAHLGRECIGRHLGALEGPPTRDGGRKIAKRGCDWCAYGLFHGPWTVALPGGGEIHCFPLAVTP